MDYGCIEMSNLIVQILVLRLLSTVLGNRNSFLMKPLCMHLLSGVFLCYYLISISLSTSNSLANILSLCFTQSCTFLLDLTKSLFLSTLQVSFTGFTQYRHCRVRNFIKLCTMLFICRRSIIPYTLCKYALIVFPIP